MRIEGEIPGSWVTAFLFLTTSKKSKLQRISYLSLVDTEQRNFMSEMRQAAKCGGGVLCCGILTVDDTRRDDVCVMKGKRRSLLSLVSGRL